MFIISLSLSLWCANVKKTYSKRYVISLRTEIQVLRFQCTHPKSQEVGKINISPVLFFTIFLSELCHGKTALNFS